MGTNTEKYIKLKQLKAFKLISIIAYLLIVHMGQMVGLPFFVWLLFTLFDFGNIDQFFAFLSVIGLTVSFITFNSTRTLKILLLDIICFMLLASPIIRRATSVPIELFNYLAFIIPTTIFGLFYIFSLYYSIRQYFKNQKSLVWQNKTAYNKSICKSRAGQCNISYVQVSAAVRDPENKAQL